uniref:Secreted protein n=1 Tax=Rhipicephalus zambeziensis TaxID=60191 RepID=A0A224YF61_9ACAR
MTKFYNSHILAVLVVLGVILSASENRGPTAALAFPLPGCCMSKRSRGSRDWTNSTIRTYRPHFTQNTGNYRHQHHTRHHPLKNRQERHQRFHPESPTKKIGHGAPPKPPRLYLPPYDK